MRTTVLTAILLTGLFAPGASASTLDAIAPRASVDLELDEVRDLASRTELRSRAVRRSVDLLLERGSVEQGDVAKSLAELEASISRFHAAMSSRDRLPLVAESDFYAVQQSYVRASLALGTLETSELDRELARLADAVYELEMYAVDLFTRIRLEEQRERDLEFPSAEPAG